VSKLGPCALCGVGPDEPCVPLGGSLYHHEGDRVLTVNPKPYSVWIHRPGDQEVELSSHSTLAAAVKKARVEAPCDGCFADPDVYAGETRVRSAPWITLHRFRRIPVPLNRGRGLRMRVFEIKDSPEEAP